MQLKSCFRVSFNYPLLLYLVWARFESGHLQLTLSLALSGATASEKSSIAIIEMGDLKCVCACVCVSVCVCVGKSVYAIGSVEHEICVFERVSESVYERKRDRKCVVERVRVCV